MKIWIVGYWIEHEGSQEEHLYLKEENARKKEAELKAEHNTPHIEETYCYQKETEDPPSINYEVKNHEM